MSFLEVSPDTPIKSQVAIIGAGPTGMAIALDLSRRGVDVALVSGGDLGPDTLSHELSRPAELPIGHADPKDTEARRFGGLSWAWGGRLVSMDAIDFQPRPELDLPGWPIGLNDINAYSAAAAEFFGIGHPDFDDGLEGGGAEVSTQLERWAAEPFLVNKHHDSFADEKGPRTYLGYTCVGGEIDESGRLIALLSRDRSGNTIRIEADFFVLAAGGLETSRLLLWIFDQNGRTAPKWTGRGYMGHLKGQMISLSATPAAQESLDYRFDGDCFVRRRFGLTAETLRTKQLANIGFWLDNWHMSDPDHHSPGLSLAYVALRSPVLGKRLMASAMRQYFLHNSEGTLPKHLRNVARNPFAAASYCLRTWNARRTPPRRPGRLAWNAERNLPFTFSAEERPLLMNGVTLSRERDMYGVPRPKIKRDLHPQDLENVRKANIRLAEQLNDGPMGQVHLLGDHDSQLASIAETSADGYHQIGTVRMGASDQDAVSDQHGRIFATKNLYAAGSALFPRSSQANPTFTAICLALRQSEHLSNLLKNRSL